MARKQEEEKRRQEAPSSSSSRCSVLNCSRAAWNGADGQPCCRTCCKTEGKNHGPDCEQRHHEEQLLAGGGASLQQTMCPHVEDTYARKNLFNRACKHCNKLKGEHFAEEPVPAFRSCGGASTHGCGSCRQFKQASTTTVYYCKAEDERKQRILAQAVQSMHKPSNEKEEKERAQEEEERKRKENEEKERARKEEWKRRMKEIEDMVNLSLILFGVTFLCSLLFAR